MAIRFELQMDEGGESEGLTPDTYDKELRYWAWADNGESHAQVRQAAKSELPTRYFNLIRSTVSVPRRVDFDKVFEVVLEFRHPGGGGVPNAPVAVDDVRVSLRSGGGTTVKQYFSLEAQQFIPGGDDAKPVNLTDANKRVIGAKGSTVTGVDVDATSIELVVETVKSGTVVTDAYLVRCALARGRVNGFPYKGFPKGTLRLTSYDAVEQTDPGTSTATPADAPPDWSITFVFDVKPNSRGKLVMKDLDGEEHTVPYQKEGHWLLDPHIGFEWVDLPSATNPGDVPQSYQAPVMRWATMHRLFEYEDFESILRL